MATIVPPPVLDMGLQQALMGFAQPFAQGLATRGQRRLTQQDIQSIQNWQAQQQTRQETPWLGGGVSDLPGHLGDVMAPLNQFPQMQSQMGQQMALGGQLGNIFAKPMLPTQQIASRKLAMIDTLQKKVRAGTATDNEKAMLEKMLAGQPMVQIGLGQPAAAAERKEIAETRASIDALNNIKELYDNAKTRTGPLVGRADPILGLFGWTTDEQEDFMAATSAFRNKIIEEITGAQMSEVEAKRILKQVPQETDPPARWEAKWKQSKRNLEYLQKRRLEILRQSGIRVPVGEQELTIGNQTEMKTPITATNPTTGKKIISYDGGQTWRPAQ